jgi:serine/threonine protein kinase
MQYCEGESLKHFLVENPENKQTATKWKIFRQILEAVNYLQNYGIIHRDIKPQNIFLDENKDARLGDFGLAVRYVPPKQDASFDTSKQDIKANDSSLLNISA